MVEQAVRDGVQVRLDYESGAGRRTERVVEAQGLLVTRHGEYLVGWCHLRRDRRVFRLDRVHAAHATDDPITQRGTGGLFTDELLDPRGGALAELENARQRIALVTSAVHAAVRRGEVLSPGAESVRCVLAHLNGWTRWQVAQLRGRATVEDPRIEAVLQRSAAARSLSQLSAELRRTLETVSRWVVGQPADVAAALDAALDHLTWHLDELDAAGHLVRRHGRFVVARCPLYSGPVDAS